MRRFLAVICSLLLVFALTSCGNLTLKKTENEGTGTLVIKLYDPQMRAVSVISPSNVSRYCVNLNGDNGFYQFKAVDANADGTGPATTDAVFTGLSAGNYSIYITATNDNVSFATGNKEVTVGEGLVEVTIEMKYLLADYRCNLTRYGSGDYGNTEYLEGTTLPETYTIKSLNSLHFPLPDGVPLHHWEVSCYSATGTQQRASYSDGGTIDLSGMTLPLKIEAIVGRDVSWSFDSNYTDGPTDPITSESDDYAAKRTGLEGRDIIIPSYLGAVTSDNTFNVKLNQRSSYCFCGWVVNYEGDLPLITSSNYSDYDFSEMQIVQPGDKFTLLGTDMTFKALWVSEDLSGKMQTINIQYGQDGYENVLRTRLNYLVDNIRTEGSGYDNYSAFINVPWSDGVFAEKYDSLNLIDSLKGWFSVCDWNVVQEHSFTDLVNSYEGYSFEGPLPDGTTFLRAPSIEYITYGDTGSEYWRTMPLSTTITIQKYDERTGALATNDGSEFLYWADEEGNKYYGGETISLADVEDLPFHLQANYGSGFIPMKALGAKDVTNAPTNAGTYSKFKNASDSSIYISNLLVGETEVTWGQWQEVYDWAISAERGENNYNLSDFARTDYGASSSYDTTGNSYPVTYVNWINAVVWCNAASEMCNLDPVYLDSSSEKDSNGRYKPLRNVETYMDSIVVDCCANGYRLPTEAEWEFAARGGVPDSDSWNYEYAGTDSAEIDTYAVTTTNSDSRTAPIRSKTANAAGLYDMMGNVAEWVFDDEGSNKILRGGSFNTSSYYSLSTHQADFQPTADPTSEYNQGKDWGFRVVRGEQKQPIKTEAEFETMKQYGSYFLDASIEIEDWDIQLFPEDKFFGHLDGSSGKGIELPFSSSYMPIFHDIGITGRIENLIIGGHFGNYSEEWGDKGILCLSNFGTIRNTAFIGTVGEDINCIFGHNNPGYGRVYSNYDYGGSNNEGTGLSLYHEEDN